MGFKKFAKDRYRPAGEWVQTTNLLHVSGVSFRKNQVRAFARDAAKSERQGRSYGLVLERQPNNAHDENAIAIYGVADVKGFFGAKTSERHIGFVPADEAESIVADLLDRGIPIGVELYEIFAGANDYFEVKFFVLAPPGNGVAARRKRA